MFKEIIQKTRVNVKRSKGLLDTSRMTASSWTWLIYG